MARYTPPNAIAILDRSGEGTLNFAQWKICRPE